MRETFDAIVVGAGMNGASTALFLAREGLSVKLVDAADGGRGASGTAVGLLRTHYDNEPECKLAALSMPYFQNWSEWIGGDCGWKQTGFLRTVGLDEIDKLRANVEMQRRFDPTAEILEPAAIGELQPQFSLSGIGAAVYEPASGTADNNASARAMTHAAKALGVSVELGTQALSVTADGAGVAGVETTHGHLASRTVVLATGAWTEQLLPASAVRADLTRKLITFAEIILPAALESFVSFMDPISDSWLSPRFDGTALISARRPETGTAVEPDGYPRKHANTEFVDEGLERLARRVPSLRHPQVVQAWSQLDSYSSDGKPVIGPVDELQGLFLNVAGSGKGHKIAPAVGELLASLITGSTAQAETLKPFSPARFANGGFTEGTFAYTQRTIG